MQPLQIFLIILAAFPLILYIFLKIRYSYWTRKHVYQPKPELFYGNVMPMIKGQLSLAETFYDIYKEVKAKGLKYGGVYWLLQPNFVPIDPVIIKHILQKDFQHFYSRGFYYHKSDVLSLNLFRVAGETWRLLRTKLTPTFTTGKMRMMYNNMLEKTEGLIQLTEEAIENKQTLRIKDVAARFTTDVIGSTVFGIECDSVKNPENEFRKHGNMVIARNFWSVFCENFIPFSILQLFRFKPFKNVEFFFKNLVHGIIDYRNKNNIYRKDFIQLLIQLQNGYELKDDESLKQIKSNTNLLTNDEIIAQALIFFVAGFETSSSTITYALLELSQNQEVQNKARKEIHEIAKKHGNKITYDALFEMDYLGKIVDETLRKHPPVSTIPRVCTKTYKVPDTNLIIEKGIKVQIPVLGIQMDPEYYPNPETFDPERFTKENKASRPDFTYIPFGEGPRVCIALRFGIMQVKCGLATLLKDYKFALDKSTTLPIIKATNTFVNQLQSEIYLDVTKV